MDQAEASFADLRIYDRSLPAAEASALFSAPAGECCIDAGLRMSFGVGDVDLTAAAMNAIDSPSVARVVPALMAHNSVDPSSTLQPCAATKSAVVREVDICGDTTTMEDCNGIVSDGCWAVYPVIIFESQTSLVPCHKYMACNV